MTTMEDRGFSLLSVSHKDASGAVDTSSTMWGLGLLGVGVAAAVGVVIAKPGKKPKEPKFSGPIRQLVGEGYADVAIKEIKARKQSDEKRLETLKKQLDAEEWKQVERVPEQTVAFNVTPSERQTEMSLVRREEGAFLPLGPDLLQRRVGAVSSGAALYPFAAYEEGDSGAPRTIAETKRLISPKTEEITRQVVAFKPASGGVDKLKLMNEALAIRTRIQEASRIEKAAKEILPKLEADLMALKMPDPKPFAEKLIAAGWPAEASMSEANQRATLQYEQAIAQVKSRVPPFFLNLWERKEATALGQKEKLEKVLMGRAAPRSMETEAITFSFIDPATNKRVNQTVTSAMQIPRDAPGLRIEKLQQRDSQVTMLTGNAYRDISELLRSAPEVGPNPENSAAWIEWRDKARGFLEMTGIAYMTPAELREAGITREMSAAFRRQLGEAQQVRDLSLKEAPLTGRMSVPRGGKGAALGQMQAESDSTLPRRVPALSGAYLPKEKK